MEKLFFIILFWAVAITAGQTRFDRTLVEGALRMASPGYQAGTDGVAPAVQAAKHLAHQLALEPDSDRARNIADTLQALLSTGQGVGGIAARPANPTETTWLVDAVKTVSEFFATLPNGQYPDGTLQKSIHEMAVGMGDGASDPDKTHFAIVSATAVSAYFAQRHSNHTAKMLPTIKDSLARSFGSVGWLQAMFADDTTWQYGRQCLAVRSAPPPFNCVIRADISRLDEAERAADAAEAAAAAASGGGAAAGEAGGGGAVAGGPADYEALYTTVTTAGATPLRAATQVFQTTVIPAKAAVFAARIMEHLKTVDWRLMLTNPAALADAIAALIAVETYRMFETADGTLRTTDPTPFDYKGTGLDPESEAILLALISAIQNSLSNPEAKVEDLIRLFGFQTNECDWKAIAVQNSSRWSIRLERKTGDGGAHPYRLTTAVRTAIRTLTTENIARVVTTALLTTVQRTQLNISKVQKLVLDGEVRGNRSIFIDVPTFTFNPDGTGVRTSRFRFLRFVRSAGDGQCGYFSMRNAEGYAQYFQTLLDNVGDEEFYRLILGMTGLQEEVYRQARALQANPATPQPLVQAAQLGGVAPQLARVADIEVGYERDSSRIPPVPMYPDGHLPTAEEEAQTNELIRQKQALRAVADAQANDAKYMIVKAVNLDTQIVAQAVVSEIDRITTQARGIQGWYTAPVGRHWLDQPLEPDLLVAHLRGYEVYYWTGLNFLDHGGKGATMKRATASWGSSDGQVALVGFLSPGKLWPNTHPRRIHVFNPTGSVHYDKLVEEGDHCDLAAAIRHAHRYGLTATVYR